LFELFVLVLVEMVAILGVIKPCTLTNNRTQRFSIPCVGGTASPTPIRTKVQY